MEYKELPFSIGLKKKIEALTLKKKRNRFGGMVYGHKTEELLKFCHKAI
jgi:hypothetical protein